MIAETKPKERPIIFGADSISAIINGRKTMTRRIVKSQPLEGVDSAVIEREIVGKIEVAAASFLRHGFPPGGPLGDLCLVRCPYGAAGDVLWVRETFAIVPWTAYARSDGVQQTRKPDPSQPDGLDIHDAAIYKSGWDRCGYQAWRSPIHMPRWASRMTLRITGIRAERLDAITPADCLAEGMVPGHWDHEKRAIVLTPADSLSYRHTIRERFMAHWDKLNRKRGYGWATNCWVWVISFERIDR